MTLNLRHPKIHKKVMATLGSGDNVRSRTVLVTGSSRGIGLAVAREFSALGDKVVVNGRVDGKRLVAAVKEIPGSVGFLADMSDYGRACEVFKEVKEKLGPVEVLVNNAGMEHFGLFSDTVPEDWAEIMGHNFNTVLNATHLAIPDMIKAKRGVIINISSIWGNTGASCEGVYAASKGAVNTFTKSMAKELGPSGIRVNAIACGAVETRMNDRLSQEECDDFIENIPLSRLGTPEEVGKLVCFLASEDASYLTGQIIGLDGGY